jgi:hypothetical protein
MTRLREFAQHAPGIENRSGKGNVPTFIGALIGRPVAETPSAQPSGIE